MKYNFTKKAAALSFAAIFWAAQALCQTPSYQWVNQAYSSAGNSNPVYNDGIAVDASGNSYITGNFQKRAVFGTAPDTMSVLETKVSSNDFGDIYVAKYDNTGKIVWVRSANNRQHNVGQLASGYQLIDVDASNNIYITGAFYDSISFGSTILTTTSNNHYSSFLAKYDASGNLAWAKKIGTGEIWADAISVDAGGNCFVTGYVNGTVSNTVTIGTFTCTSPSQFFVAKFNSSGNLAWGRGNTGAYCTGTALKAVGSNLFLTGQAQQGSVFGSDTVKSSASNSNYVFFVTKMDTSGNYAWARGSSAYDSHSESHGSAITADNSGNCYVAGDYAALFKLGSFNYAPASSVTQRIAFLAKYDASGSVQSVATFSCTAGQNNLVSALCYGSNKVTLAGNTPGATNFGSATLAYSGNYAAQFSTGLANLSVAYISGTLGSASSDYNYGLTTDAAGNLYVSGRFSHSETFGSLTNTNPNFFPSTYLGKFGALATGIESLGMSQAGIIVYPNPATDNVMIDAGSERITTIEVFDLTGRMVYFEKASQERIIVNCGSWNKGLYIIKVNSGHSQKTTKLIVE